MISIIVPIYNAAPYLADCVGSLTAQTVQDIEILLVDDGSTDDSAALAQSFVDKDARIHLIRQQHAGQSAARNNGMRHARGEFIAFVDADDRIEPDWCARHLAAIHGVDYVQSETPRNKYQYTVVWGRLYRRETLANLRFEEGLIYEDILFSVDLWLSGARCRTINYRGYHYTPCPHSTTSRPHPEAQQRVLRLLRERAHHADCLGKAIIWYTLIRLKIHFLRQ